MRCAASNTIVVSIIVRYAFNVWQDVRDAKGSNRRKARTFWIATASHRLGAAFELIVARGPQSEEGILVKIVK